MTPREVQGRSRLTCEPCAIVYWGHYSLGVGGVIVDDGRVLFVRDARGEHNGRWTLPGGYVEFDERFDDAVVREVREETGLHTEVVGLAGVRHRADVGNNTTYVAFRLEVVGGTLRPDGVEVDRAEFLTPAEMEAERRLTGLSRMIALSALDTDERTPLRRHPGTAVGVPHAVVYLWE